MRSSAASSAHEKRAQLDLFYVDNWSLLADLSIIVRTVPVVLLRKGAF